MLRFDRSRQAPPGFSLDKRDHAMRRGLKQREWRLILTLPFALLLLALFIQYLIGFSKLIPNGPLEPVIVERLVAPVPPPRLADAPALPAAADIEQQRPGVGELMRDRATVRHEDALDALTIAWGDALLTADAASPPIPQRVMARDLLLEGVKPGAAVTVHGRLLDSVAAPLAGSDRVLQRLVLGLDEQQICQVLAPADAAALVIGREILVTGRFLGTAPLPTGTAGETQVPLLAARIARPDTRDDGSLVLDAEDEWRGSIPAEIPADLWDDVSDERSVLESRPYYHLLGKALIDLQAVDTGTIPESGNAKADEIHTDPTPFRGSLFTVTGIVYRTWEDDNVRRDQPFGVARALRMLLWSRDFGKVTEILNGKPVIKSQILRLYEVCVIGDQPAPERGDKVQVEGRFFKFRAIPVQGDTLRDARNNVERQSDNVYTFVFVGAGYTPVAPPPRYELGWTGIIFGVVALVLGLLIFLIRRKDHRSESRVRDQIRVLRQTRHALRQRSPAGGNDPGLPAPTTGIPPLTDPPPSP